MEPRISDFGIAKHLDQSSTSAPSTAISGTIGYIAPENAFTTTKGKESDVYSYGVVLLELITRKTPSDPSFTEKMDIVGWVRSVWSETQQITMIVDLFLLDETVDSHIAKQVIGMLLIALKCSDKEPNNRPTMRDVINQLLDLKS
ncbi:serine-threonine protein kinase, plant-type, putative [Ricinus communis]|uniref:Serine-threonine protein kinase, plant-type, putative n=1 Tax=Ricinus communis TaxID=3988 RepID=B9RGQ5_RICCO|nr:serine-threonine protein kinase, plant-type, putative [Ricinus communis]